MSQAQNGHGLRVRVVDPEDPDAPLGPAQRDVAAGLPERDPVGIVGRPEVDRVDVLVLLRRVLGVADRAVGPPGEPLGVVAHPGVVGRALERVVEGHLEAELAGPGDERIQVLERPELGVHRLVPAGGRADGPGAAGIVRSRRQRVVPTLAVGDADGVDRREVDDVEAELGHVVQMAGGAPQAAEGPREQLVPGPGRGAGAGRPTAAGGPTPTAGRRDGRRGARRRRRRTPRRGAPRASRPCGAPLPRRPRAGRGRGSVEGGREVLEEQPALFELERHVLARRHLHLDLMPPGGVPIGPRLHDQLVGAERRGRELAHPSLSVVELAQRRGLPALGAHLAPSDPCAQAVVAVGHEHGRDGEPLPHHCLGGEPRGGPRPHVVNHDRRQHTLQPRRSAEHHHRAEDLAALHPVERLLDLVEPDGLGHEPVEGRRPWR